MILKKRESNITIYIVIATVVMTVIAYFALNKKNIVLSLHNESEYLMSHNPGFSFPRNLIDTGEYYSRAGSTSLKLKSIVSNLPKIIAYKLKGNDNELENIDVSIKFLNLKSILKDRKIAVNSGYLSDPSYVNATIEYDQKTYKAKIRLKGNIADHWMSEHRMSLRVRLESGESILGFNTFSIQKPRARQYPYEQAFQEALRDGGNLAAKYKFSNISVNGKNWGVMILEEEVSKEFLEKQRAKDSIVFRFSDDKKRLKHYSDYHSDYRISDEKLFATIVRQKKYLKDIENRKKYTYILEERLKEKHAEIYSTSHHMKSFIASLLWNNQHTLYNSNSKYYFNPYTLQLEPITADQLNFSLYADQLGLVLDNIPINEVYRQVISLPMDDHDKDKYLADTIELFSNTEKKINQYHKYFPLDKYKKDIVLIDNINFINRNKDIFYEWIDNYEIKQKDEIGGKDILFSTQDTIFPQHLHVRHYNDGKILLFNLLPEKVKINRISFDGNTTRHRNFIIPGYIEGNYEPYVVRTDITGIQDNKIIIDSTYKDNVSSTIAYPTLIQHGISNPLLLNTAHEFDFINQLDNKVYEIESGDWIVNKPIIIEGNLHILPGVNLKLHRDAYIIVKGSITAIGDRSNLVTLKAVSDTWKGIYVLNADKKSQFKNVNISNVSALEDGLLKLTGGITFYMSDVDFENVKISNVKAEDALNIVESKFSLNSVYIKNTVSDGLDSDFSKGIVLNSEFSDIGGDALDISGSNVSINQAKASNVKDKAISAGEKSMLTVRDSNFNNIGVGVASKDGSSVVVSGTEILNYKLYGAMSYLKKDFYDMPSLTISNSIVSDGRAYIRQKGTSMTVDDISIPETKISVEELYKTSVMAK
jgi:hypothetical protein